jgi:hypothetical protein
MRFVLAIMLALPLPLAASAAEPNPNTLTPKEADDGWLLLFDGETMFGWNVTGAGKVEKDGLLLGGDRETTAVLTTSFANFQMRLDVDGDGELVARAGNRESSIGIGHGGAERLMLTSTKLPGAGGVTIGGQSGIKEKDRPVLSRAVLTFGGDQPLILSLRVATGKKLTLHGARLRPLGLKPLFNGKNLDGWKKFESDPKRAKSQFTVTKEGWLNIKNGPGDLQTTGQWADFVLQLDCISNGNHLNSGVFFRCIPGAYQNGYEAQIRNQFTKEPKQEYHIEEYDPQTHRLKGKKVKRTAVDYGTGAIYRRQPARREVARDHEWFTLTVAASGRHIATWVNGIQVTDWTDNRPLRDNARNGCRLKKGPISLQGHDPTTNLSFRNLRIADLGAALRK